MRSFICLRLCLVFLTIAACAGPVPEFPPKIPDTDTPTQGTSTRADAPRPYQTPEWVSLFTTNPKVLAYRWYTANDCPTGGYSYQDDLYLFAPEEVLSPIEMEQLEKERKVIGTEGFHSTDGYICMALSERIHPSNFTALHELAHAIVYTEHGLTGHNKIMDKKLIDLALRFDEADCRTDDIRLMNFIAWHTPIYFGGAPPRKDILNDPLFKFCYPDPSTPTEVPPTAIPFAALPTSTPTVVLPTSTPPAARNAPMVTFIDSDAMGRRINFADDSHGDPQLTQFVDGTGLIWAFNIDTLLDGQSVVITVSFKETLEGPSTTELRSAFPEGGDYFIFARDHYDPDTPLGLVHVWRVVDGQLAGHGQVAGISTLKPRDLTPETSSAGARFLKSFRVYTPGIDYIGEPSAPLVFEFPPDYPTE